MNTKAQARRVAVGSRATTRSNGVQTGHLEGATGTRGVPEQLLELQRLVGNQAVVQRLITTMPQGHIGNDPTTAKANLGTWLTGQVAANNLTFKSEFGRVQTEMKRIRPTVAKALVDSSTPANAAVGKATTGALAIAAAAPLETLCTDMNSAVNTYQLDTAASTVSSRVQETRQSHHPDYFFQLPGDTGEKKFDLDTWSRPGKDFHGGQSTSATIKGIIDEAVRDWDSRDSIVTLLVKRLLGEGPDMGGTAGNRNVSALFMSQPTIGPNFTRILLAAQQAIGIRVADTRPYAAMVDHWTKTTRDNKVAESIAVDWKALLRPTREAFRTVFQGTTTATQAATDKAVATAIAADPQVSRLVTLGAIDLDTNAGTFALNTKPHTVEGVIYQARADQKFNFNFNHFSAILFFEWQAVSDLRVK